MKVFRTFAERTLLGGCFAGELHRPRRTTRLKARSILNRPAKTSTCTSVKKFAPDTSLAARDDRTQTNRSDGQTRALFLPSPDKGTKGTIVRVRKEGGGGRRESHGDVEADPGPKKFRIFSP